MSPWPGINPPTCPPKCEDNHPGEQHPTGRALDKFLEAYRPPLPTVGRIVHWQPFNSPAPLAAIITAVNADNFADNGHVKLAVFKLVGDLIHFSAPFSETPEEGHWNWPPRT